MNRLNSLNRINRLNGPPKQGGVSWSAYWATLISAEVYLADPTKVELTFPSAKSLGATDFTIAGFTISSASWSGATITLVTSVAVTATDSVVVTFVPTGGTATAVIYPEFFIKGEANNVMLIGDSFGVGIAADVEATEAFFKVLGTYLKSEFGDAGDGMHYGNFLVADTYSNNFYQWTTDFTAGSSGAGILGKCLNGINTKNASIEVTGKYFDLIHYGNDSYTIKFTLTVDGGDPQTITYAPAAGHIAYKERITFSTSGTHTIVISGGADMICLLGGVICYSGDPGVNLIWAAAAGATTLSYKPAVLPDALNIQLDTFQPKLTIIELGYNDYAGQVALNDYESRITEFVNKANDYGQVVLVNMMHYYDGQVIPIEDYNTRLSDIATATGATLVDMHTLMGTSLNITNNGWSTGSASAHPTTSGHKKFVEEIYKEVVGREITWIHGQDSLPTVAFEAETTSLLALMAAQPTTGRQRLINKTIADLKDAGLWTAFDALYMLCGHTEQATLLNWKEDDHHILKRNSPVFAVDAEWHGDAATGYLEPEFNFTTESSNWTLDSAGISVYMFGRETAGGYHGSSASFNTMFRFQDGNFAINGWPNVYSAGVPLKEKFFTLQRIDATHLNAYYNGALKGTSEVLASVALVNDNFDLFRYNAATYNNARLSFIGFHRALDSTEAAALYAIIKYYIDNR